MGDLWNELDLAEAKAIDRPSQVKARGHGPPVEPIPRFFLRSGRRFIAVGIESDTGPGMYRRIDPVAFGPLVSPPFADWDFGERAWELRRDLTEN